MIDHLMLHITAPADYTALNQVVRVTSTGNLSIPVTINDDAIPEATEFFTVGISSMESFVSIGQGFSQINILDNGELLSFHSTLHIKIPQQNYHFDQCYV